MNRIKGLIWREKDVEIPEDVETRTHEEPGESMARRILFKGEPSFITPYENVMTMVGMRPPALKLHSSDPYCTMRARRDIGGTPIQLFPGVPYPIVWTPAEQWRPPVMSESEKQIDFQIPLGRTLAIHGRTKRVETEAWALVPISQMPYGWARLGIVGRSQFSLDVVSTDFSTEAELARKRYEIEHLINMTREAALIELLESAKHMPEGQRTFAYDEMLRGLQMGGTKGLLEAKDPEAALTRKIEELIKRRDELRKSKR